VHSATQKTPYEGWHGQKPDVTHLKMFGSRVCVKRTGSRRCKLDRHNFTGLFLGYSNRSEYHIPRYILRNRQVLPPRCVR
jgi:hypothetical protein